MTPDEVSKRAHLVFQFVSYLDPPHALTSDAEQVRVKPHHRD